MRAGPMRHRITLQQRSLTADSFGQPLETWSDVTTAWAEIRPLRSKEAELAKQVYPTATHKVFMRYVAAVGSDWRVVFKGRVFNINEVLNVNAIGRELRLICSEATGGVQA